MNTLEIQKEIERLNNERTVLSQRINVLTDRLVLMCDHVEVAVENYYIEGSYYNRSEYRQKKTCKICKKTLCDELTSLGGYG